MLMQVIEHLIMHIESGTKGLLSVIAGSLLVLFVVYAIYSVSNRPVEIRNGFQYERSNGFTTLLLFLVCGVTLFSISLCMASTIRKGSRFIKASIEDMGRDGEGEEKRAISITAEFMRESQEETGISFAHLVGSPEKTLEESYAKVTSANYIIKH